MRLKPGAAQGQNKVAARGPGAYAGLSMPGRHPSATQSKPLLVAFKTNHTTNALEN